MSENFTPTLRNVIYPKENPFPSGQIAYIDDGDFSQPVIVGTPEPRYPFSSQGDNTSWELMLKVRQDHRAYFPLPPMYPAQRVPAFANVLPGVGYVIDPGDPRDIGSGLLEYEVVLASVPQNRMVGGTINWTFSYIIASGANLLAFPILRTAHILWEYSLYPFQPRLALRFIFVDGVLYTIGDFGTFSFQKGGNFSALGQTTIQPGQSTSDFLNQFVNSSSNVFGVGVTAAFTPFTPKRNSLGIVLASTINPAPGQFVLAQDSECDLYKCGIYYRKSVFIQYPTLNNLQTQ